MKKIAVYPGTFDPITYGHIDVIKKALKLFDKVIVATSDGANKNYLFVLFIFLIEILVAFLQAYIFTLLSAVFIGLAVKEEEHH